MSLAEGANAALRFALEVCALAALAYWGFSTNETLAGDLIAGIGAPLAFALAWGAWIAPKAPYRLDDPVRLLLEVTVFAIAVAALANAGSVLLAALLAVAVMVNIGFMFVLGQRRLGGI
jgi:hypothetical protein